MKTAEHDSEPGADGMSIRLAYEADTQPHINDAISAHPEKQQDVSTKTSTPLPTLPVPHPTPSYWHTTHPNNLTHHRSTADLPPTTPILIIGSGITGAFAAHHLTTLTHQPILILEARTLCSGATGRNGGHCQPLCYDQLPEIAEFELRNIAHLSTLIANQDIQCDWMPYPGGGCHAYYSPSLFSSIKTQIQALTHTHPTLASQITIVESPSQLARLRIPTACGAILQAQAASLHPYKLVTHIWRTLLENPQINLQTNTAVTGLDRGADGTWHARTDRGTVIAEQVLLATNAYTARLAKGLAGLIVPVRGQMSALKPMGWAKEEPLSHDYGFRGVMERGAEEDDYLVQRPVGVGGEFMFGGGRMVGIGEGVGTSDDAVVDARVARYLSGMLPRLMDVSGKGKTDPPTEMQKLPETYAAIEADLSTPQASLTPLAEWTGIMGYSRDNHPWVGGVPDADGLWVCAGYTGHGMPNASLCARHVAGLIGAAVGGGDWRDVERAAVRRGDIPEGFVVSRERMEEAGELPEVGEKVRE